jgi:hypothetical protein
MISTYPTQLCISASTPAVRCVPGLSPKRPVCLPCALGSARLSLQPCLASRSVLHDLHLAKYTSTLPFPHAPDSSKQTRLQYLAVVAAPFYTLALKKPAEDVVCPASEYARAANPFLPRSCLTPPRTSAPSKSAFGRNHNPVISCWSVR